MNNQTLAKLVLMKKYIPASQGFHSLQVTYKMAPTILTLLFCLFNLLCIATTSNSKTLTSLVKKVYAVTFDVSVNLI